MEAPHLKWNWFYEPTSQVLFCTSSDDEWQKYVPASTRSNRRYTFSTNVTRFDLNLPHFQRATIHWDRHHLYFDGAAPTSTGSLPPPASLRDFINRWADGWPLQDSFFPPEPHLLTQALHSGSGVLVTDGSYKPLVSRELGAAAWQFECSLTGAVCCGEVQTSGQPHEVNPYRSELQGIHTGLLGILAFCQFHDISQGSFKVGCDCESGYKLAAKRGLVVPVGIKHSDLIRAIRMVVSKLKDRSITVEFFHIDGHQDDYVEFDDLDRPSQINVLMDTAAKARIDRMAAGPITHPPDRIQFEGWSCHVQGIKMTSDATRSILRVIHAGPMIDYLSSERRNRMSAEAFPLVDWMAVGDAMSKSPPLFRMWASKHNSRYCGVGHMQHIWGFWDHDRCPCCQQPDETTTHLLLCPHAGMTLTWQIEVDTVKEWLEQVDTHEDIITCLSDALTARDTDHSFLLDCPQSCLEAAWEQEEIGWQNFVEGKLSKTWRDMQEVHYASIGSQRTASAWATGLVTRLLEAVHNMWLYRNAVDHEHDQQGLKRKEAQELAQAIVDEFDLGTENLSRRDHHYIRRGRDSVNALSASDKQAWLRGIRLARESQTSTPADLQRQREFMVGYFAAG